MENDVISIPNRAELYGKILKGCKALPIVNSFTQPTDKIQALEAIREERAYYRGKSGDSRYTLYEMLLQPLWGG